MQTCGAGRRQAMESVNDAPDGAEQPHKGSDSASGGQPYQPFFQPPELGGSANLEGAPYRLQAANPRLARILSHGGLALDFAIAGKEDPRQRALLQSVAEGSNLRQLLALPEDFEEFRRLAPRGPESAKFSDDNRPRENRKRQKDQQDTPGHRTRIRQELPNFALVEILCETLVEHQKRSSQLTSYSRPGDSKIQSNQRSTPTQGSQRMIDFRMIDFRPVTPCCAKFTSRTM